MGNQKNKIAIKNHVMIQFTFEQLHELKRLSCKAQKFELAANVLQFIKQEFPKIEAERVEAEKLKDNKIKKSVNKILFRKGLGHGLIRCGGEPIDFKFMEGLFPQ